MKKEGTKKNKLLLWIIIAAVVLLTIVGTVLALVLGGGSEKESTEKAELYWNVDKASYTDADSGFSTREPGEDGLYHVRFAYGGGVEELTVADKQLVNYIDTMDCMGLVQDADGLVVDALDVKDIALEIGKRVYVRNVQGNTLIANTSIAMNGMNLYLEISDLAQICDVSLDADPLGGYIDLESLDTMDCITVYGDEQEQVTHIYMVEHPVESKVYWREKAYYSSTEGTSRVPDENGVYSMNFFCEGELVTLKTRDRAIVEYIDYKSDYKAHFGFVFDEEGYIVKRMESELGIKAQKLGESYDITAIDGDTIELTMQFGSEMGATDTFTLSNTTVIYDVSKAAFAEGRQGKPIDSLQVGDRVVAWISPKGDTLLVYVTERLVDSPMYYNVNRKYSTAKQESTRQPNADGWYEVELAVNGEIKTFRTRDKAKIDYLDSFYPKALGLKADENNVIEYVYHANCVYGYKYYCDGRYVQKVIGSVVELWSRPQDKTFNGILDPEYVVYDMSGVGEMGSVTTLQEGDCVLVYQKPGGELTCFYVLRRACQEADLYWNLSRKYDSTTKQTTREPDADGWYVFTMAMGGKTVTVKTRSKAMATKVDSFSPGAVGLIVENGIIQAAFDAMNVNGGNQLTSGTYVSAVNSDGTAQVYSLKYEKYTDFTLAEDCKIYNISAAYVKEKGEPTTLQLGDMITVYANIKNEAAVIFVRSRETDNMYWKQDRFYDSTNAVTTRVPDENGWYVYNLAVNGTVKTYKTKDVEVASKMDASESGFGLLLNGDEVLRYVPAAYVKDVSTDGLVNWDVVSVSGNQVTVKYNRPGSGDTGKTRTITLASGAKIMDVSPNAEKFGAYVKLQPGDRIRSYVNSNGNHLYVWVKYRATREKGVESYCDHCGETVYWNPYVGGGVPKADGHYYLVADVTATSQTSIGSDDLDYEVVIDLNGHTLTRKNGRALLAYKGDTLTILDSVGGGCVQSAGSSAGHGAVAMVTDKGTLNLMGGTLQKITGETEPAYGGVVAVNREAVLNISGGTVTGGSVTANEKYDAKGGGIYCTAATVNMSGGTVENCAAARGGSVYLASDAVFNMTGGTVSGGKAAELGGSFVVSTDAVLNISGGTVSGGSAKYGGNIYLLEGTVNLSGGQLLDGAADIYGGNVYAAGKTLNISGGKVSGGTAGEYAANIYFNSKSTCDWNLTGGEIAGDVRIAGGGKITVSGTPKVSVGSEGGMNLRNGVLLTLGELKSDAQIAMSVTGQFTEASEKAADYLGCFKTATDGGMIYEKDGALYAADGQVKLAYCDHCNTEVIWKAWTHEDATALVVLTENDHYYLADDADMSVQTNIGTSADKEAGVLVDVVIDLNGKTWTSAKRALSVYGKLTLVDSVGGGTVSATGNGNGGVILVTGGTVDMYGGTVKSIAQDLTKVGKGGTVYLSSGSVFNMYGGTVCDGRTEEEGGNVYADSAVFNLFGGTVCAGSAASGGNIYLAKGTFTMTGGSVTGGNSAGSGGNIYSQGASVTVISGGEINGGVAGTMGHNFYANNASAQVTLSGGIVDGDMFLRNAGSVTISGAPKVTVGTAEGLTFGSGVLASLGDMTEGAQLHITATGAFTTENGNAQAYLDAEYFKSVPADQVISVQDNVLVAERIPEGATKAHCDHCDADVYWYAWDQAAAEGIAAMAAGDHHYRMEADYTGIQTEQIALKDGVNLVLDLNGKTYETASNRIFHVSAGSELTVMDGGEGGIMRSPGTGKKGGGLIYATDAKVNLMGGTLQAVRNDTPVSAGGVLYLNSGSEFTMTGGTVTGGFTSSDGGNIYMDASTFIMTGGTVENGVSGNRGGNILIGPNCTFEMSGGTIRGGQAAKQGGNIRQNYSTSSIVLSGGTIYGDMTIFSAKSFKLSGSPKILMGNSAGLILGEGIDPSAGNASLKLTLENLNTDAQIYISAVGDITDAAAAEYLECFKGALRTTVTANAETGVLEAAQGTTGYCPHCWQAGLPATWTDASQIGQASSGAYTTLKKDAHYYLTDDVTRSGNGSRLNIGQSSADDVFDIVIDLAGYDWTTTNNRVAQIFDKLSVMDSIGGGTMSGKMEDDYATVACINSDLASLTLYSGTLTSYDGADNAIVNANKGVFTMYGGYIAGTENATKATVTLGTKGTADYQGGLVDGQSKKEEQSDA